MQEYDIGVQLLETGTELVSPHLRWLIRHMLIDYLETDKLDLLCYRTQTPDEAFGEAHSPSRSITINLIKHFDDIIPKLEEPDNMYTSLKCMLLKEILDTAAHEGHHIMASHKTDNWNNSALEEEEATKIGNDLAWRVAKKYDVEIDNFGPILDDAIEEFIEMTRKEIATDEEEGIETSEWATLQVYMYDNKLAFYNPNVEKSAYFREAFEIGAEDEDPWIDDYKKFVEDVTKIIPTTENTPQPQYAAAQTAAQPNQSIHTEIGVLSNDLLDAATYDDDDIPFQQAQPPAEAQSQPAAQSPTGVLPQIAPPTQPVQPTQQQTAQNTATNILSPPRILETVLRRLFYHVQTKCEFNSDGGYNNPYAVLEGVPIADIPGAQELFIAMDTTDPTGKFVNKMQCNGVIKGLVSKDNLPRYTLYLQMAGQLHKRTLIAQNPNKLDSNQQSLTTWALAARSGKRIMMLLEDGVGIKAHLELEKGMLLGQEQYKIW